MLHCKQFDCNRCQIMLWNLHFYPRPILDFGYYRCLRLCVHVSVYQSLACPSNYSGPVQARITKLVPTVQITSVKGANCFGGQLTLTYKVKVYLKFQIYPILSLSAPSRITHSSCRITKFRPKVQNTLVKLPFFLVGDWSWPLGLNLT